MEHRAHKSEASKLIFLRHFKKLLKLIKTLFEMKKHNKDERKANWHGSGA